ncbi:hypothetical protein EB796_025153 [Bugula neritina]|uniref:Uncharacterized protein n=1 Tax=Bugula neritina TaxID=10212 RepID=A0A7J7IT14_BUGNE|nr:hypothetical protein EB796_025153 [Bugula neritina]
MGKDEKLEAKCDNGNIFDRGGTLYRALLCCALVYTTSSLCKHTWEMMRILKESVIMVIYLTVMANSTELSCGM